MKYANYLSIRREKQECIEIPLDFVSVDFETLYSHRVSACSIGMAKFKNGELVDEFYSLIRPPFDFFDKKGHVLTWIHGFTEKDFENEKNMAELMPEIENFIENLPLVAHNACVERNCFSQTIDYYGIATNTNLSDFIDTYPLSRVIEKKLGISINGTGTHSLDGVCKRFNLPDFEHHNALDDAKMCGFLLLKLKEASDCVNRGENYVVDLNEKPKKKKSQKYRVEDIKPLQDLETVKDSPFKGYHVVLTGFTLKQSQEYGHLLHELGATLCKCVNSKTKYLICGSNPGPKKMEQALELDIEIINEQRLLEILKTI